MLTSLGDACAITAVPRRWTMYSAKNNVQGSRWERISMVIFLFSPFRSFRRVRFSVGESYIADASRLSRSAETIDSRRCTAEVTLVPAAEDGTLPRFIYGNACMSMFGVLEPLLIYRLFFSDCSSLSPIVTTSVALSKQHLEASLELLQAAFFGDSVFHVTDLLRVIVARFNQWLLLLLLFFRVAAIAIK